MRFLLAAIPALCLALSTRADEWKPAKAPLMTRWAKDVRPDRAHPEYPRPQFVRAAWRNLNGVWQFAEAKAGEQPPVGKDLAGKILVPFPVESALSGVMKPLQRLWYRRAFTVPEEWAGRRVLLHFGAVNWEATVWLNGRRLDSHKGGYDGFSVDLTGALKKGGEQELIVGVYNPGDGGTQPRGKQVRKPGGAYHTANTGIWQTVWLEPVPERSITGLTIVPDVRAGKVRFAVHTRGEARGRRAALWEVHSGGKPLLTWMSATGTEFSQSVPSPRLWSPESPFLYDLRVSLLEKEQDSRSRPLDVVTSYFGMREVRLGKDDNGVTRLLLNGKPYFQMGLLDQGYWPDGLYTAPTDEALRYDVEVAKRLGFNLARKHAKVEPARWYYHCDRLGLLVWQDMPSGDKVAAPGEGEVSRSPEAARQFEHELARMVEGLKNHPCVVMWVPFSEGQGQYDTKKIVQMIKRLDPSRLVDNASGWNDRECGDAHDVHAYPGPDSPRPEENRAAVLGEFGGLGLRIDGHTWPKAAGGNPGARDREGLTRRYETLLQGVWRLRERPGLSAAVYAQATDVETEVNGLLTYDRAVLKVDPQRVAGANRGDFSRMPKPGNAVPASRRD
jgi:beta-galactosidase/beta-glucuronidase